MGINCLPLDENYTDEQPPTPVWGQPSFPGSLHMWSSERTIFEESR
jgi:hypothetical protein